VSSMTRGSFYCVSKLAVRASTLRAMDGYPERSENRDSTGRRSIRDVKAVRGYKCGEAISGYTNTGG
jgi:hypothetical protein